MKPYEDPNCVKAFGEIWAAEQKLLDQISRTMSAALPVRWRAMLTIITRHEKGKWSVTLTNDSGIGYGFDATFEDEDPAVIADMIRRSFTDPDAPAADLSPTKD